MNEILFDILQIVVITSIVITMRYIIPYFKLKLGDSIDAKVFEEILKAVKSVEQDELFKFGPEKKEEVIVRITAWLNEHNICITQTQISQLIETAVWTMNNKDKTGGSD